MPPLEVRANRGIMQDVTMWVNRYYYFISQIGSSAYKEQDFVKQYGSHLNKHMQYVLVDEDEVFDTVEAAVQHRRRKYGTQKTVFAVDEVTSSLTFPAAQEPYVEFHQILVRGRLEGGQAKTPFLASIILGIQVAPLPLFFYIIHESFKLLA